MLRYVRGRRWRPFDSARQMSAELALVPIKLLFVVSLLLGTGIPVYGADRHSAVCRLVASMLHEGTGNRVGVGPGGMWRPSLLQTLANNSGGRLRLARWTELNSAQSEPYLLSLGMASGSAQSISARSYQVRAASARGMGGELVAIVDVGGNTPFASVSVFRPRKGRLLAVMGPGILNSYRGVRSGTRFSLGSIGGTLILAVEEIDLLEHRPTINLAPWTGDRWRANCGVVANYHREFVSDTAFCGLTSCSAARRAAKRIAVAITRGDHRLLPPPTAEASEELALRDLQTFAKIITPGDMPKDFYRWFEPYFPRLSHMVLTTVDGHPTLVGLWDWQTSPAAEGAQIGYVVAMWHATGAGKPKPVAGFRLGSSTAVVRSGYVTR